MAHFADRTITVRGHHLNQNPHSARPVSFERHFVILLAFQLARSSLNGPLNIVVRHVFIFRRQDRCAQHAPRLVRPALGDPRRGEVQPAERLKTWLAATACRAADATIPSARAVEEGLAGDDKAASPAA